MPHDPQHSQPKDHPRDQPGAHPSSASAGHTARHDDLAVSETPHASEDYYRALFEQAAIGILHVALDGRLLRANACLCRMLGYSLDELTGHHFSEFTHPDDVPANQALYERALHEETATQTMEKRYRTKDGALLWAQLSVTLVRGERDHPAYFIATVENITERKTLETALRQTAQQMATRSGELEAIFEAVSDGVMVYDLAGKITRMNTAATRLLGVPPECDYAALPINERAELIELRDAEGHPLPPARWPYMWTLRGEATGGESAPDLQLRTIDGRELILNITSAPIRDEHGQRSGAVIVIRDVSERRRLSRRTHETLTALLAMAEALVANDGEDEAGTRLAQVAAPRLAELTLKLLGCQRVSIHAIEGPDERMRPITIIGMRAEMERAWWQEWRQRPRLADIMDAPMFARLHAGEVSIIDLTQPSFSDYANPYQIVTLLVAPMRLGERLVGILSLDHDRARYEYSPEEIALASAVAKLSALIIERERLLEQREAARSSALALREANRHMDEFLSMASHELRNPITSIRASIQIAERRIKKLAESPTEPLAAESVARLLDPLERGERQTSLLDRLVGDLLEVSRIQTNRLELRMTRVDLVGLTREVVEQHRLAHPERAIQLSLPERAPILAHVDPDRIGQVITNYLTNALKYSPVDRPVAVALEVASHQARLLVRDEGPGLPTAERHRIWERFHQAPGVNISGGKAGLGLGLFISRGFIERHGGQVGVESEPGHGATFWFTLPLLTPAAS